jgi:hypothetical protein
MNDIPRGGPENHRRYVRNPIRAARGWRSGTGCRAAIRLRVPRERFRGRVANETRRPPPHTTDSPGCRHRPQSGKGPTPTPGRVFIRGTRLTPTLAELERELVGVAIQGTVSRWGEVALLAFDPAKGSADLVDLSATTDIELVRLAGRSWMSERR